MNQPQPDHDAVTIRANQTLAQLMLNAFCDAWAARAPGDAPVGPHESADIPPDISPDLGDTLEQLLATGRRAWPDLVAVDGATFAADFAAHLARQIPTDTADLDAAISTLAVADLYLAAACTLRLPGAIEAFNRVCAPAIDGSIAGVDPCTPFRAEVRQALHERLFIGSDGDPPRIASYAGRGPLSAWVAIVTQRLALHLRRSERNRARVEDQAAHEPLAAPNDPELAYLKRRYHAEFEAAYRAALESLSERDRSLLRMKLFEGLTLERLGAMHAADPSTVSRWIEKARAAVRDATREHLRARLNVSPSEFASLARLVMSQLDVSIAALFDRSSRHQP